MACRIATSSFPFLRQRLEDSITITGLPDEISPYDLSSELGTKDSETYQVPLHLKIAIKRYLFQSWEHLSRALL